MEEIVVENVDNMDGSHCVSWHFQIIEFIEMRKSLNLECRNVEVRKTPEDPCDTKHLL